MQLKVKNRLLLLVAALVASASCATAAYAQQDATPRAELAFGYNYVHSNAPPGACGCFGIHGANASFAWGLKPGTFDLVGDVSITHGASISSNAYSLTLSTYTGGVRYHPHLQLAHLKPYGEVLVGGAHAGGSLVDTPNALTSGGGSAFAALLGGGVDWRINKTFAVRLIQADYLVTTFHNGVNDHQNSLRLDAGLVFHF